MKEWVSPVYAFFEPTPHVIERDGHRAHEFKCAARGCKATVRRYLDKKDARSTGNTRKHVKVYEEDEVAGNEPGGCKATVRWGDTIMSAADDAKDANEVRIKIMPGRGGV